MKVLLCLISAALLAQAQAPAPVPLSKMTIRGVVCSIFPTAARDGLVYECVREATPQDKVASGSLIPVAASVTTTIQVQVPSETPTAPPETATFAITASRTHGTATVPGAAGMLMWNISTNGALVIPAPAPTP